MAHAVMLRSAQQIAVNPRGPPLADPSSPFHLGAAAYCPCHSRVRRRAEKEMTSMSILARILSVDGGTRHSRPKRGGNRAGYDEDDDDDDDDEEEEDEEDEEGMSAPALQRVVDVPDLERVMAVATSQQQRLLLVDIILASSAAVLRRLIRGQRAVVMLGERQPHNQYTYIVIFSLVCSAVVN